MNEKKQLKKVSFERQAHVSGDYSHKGMRLVDYCLGPFAAAPPASCSQDLDYLSSNECILLLHVDESEIVLQNMGDAELKDQKKIVQALLSQGAEFPSNLTCWLITMDQGPRRFDPGQGLHISGMRDRQHPEVVLVPTSNRNRVLGPNLARQMRALKDDWTEWGDKSDTAWWGGALSGMRWDQTTSLLSRMRVLKHFSKNPDKSVFLQPTFVPKDTKFRLPEGILLQDDFTKKEAFRHKCIVLLPGNDIASGSSWYFGGNSVVLMPRPHMDHILFFELHAWKHYVPLEDDPSDILVKLNWVLDHQEEAQRIVGRAHKRLQWLAGPEYLWACNEVLRRISPMSGK